MIMFIFLNFEVSLETLGFRRTYAGLLVEEVGAKTIRITLGQKQGLKF